MTAAATSKNTPVTTATNSASFKNEPRELVVLVSGVFHAAYTRVLPAFERESGIKVRSELSPSLGDSPQSVESRLARGEDADVLDRYCANWNRESLFRNGGYV